jgi:putative acetyltransferase
MITRHERPSDKAAIYQVQTRAFAGVAEADLVDRLRANNKATLSLVAEDEGLIVGHILFSPATIETATGSLSGLGLAPLAVVPERQRQGIGSLLIEEGLKQCRAAKHSFVVVLGHADYYPRFGFVPASRFNIKSEYDVADENFMALELQPNALNNCAGVAHYQPEFIQV